jgi:DNA-binding NarL/FixJ family response regulator
MEPLRIIIADDHPLFREGLERALLRIMPGATILMASNGDQVMVLLEKEDPDLIFLDIRMPGRDGIEITQAIRHLNKKVKIVIVTMKDDMATVLKIFQVGGNGYLHKNTDRAKLQRVIEVVMSGDIYLSEEVDEFRSAIISNGRLPGNGTSASTQLSEREMEILILICNQYSTKEIADKLHVTEKTVETHRFHLMSKTQSKNVVGLTMFAIQKKYFVPEHRKREP